MREMRVRCENEIKLRFAKNLFSLCKLDSRESSGIKYNKEIVTFTLKKSGIK